MNDVGASLQAFLRDEHVAMTDIASLLDDASPSVRREALFSLSRAQQRALYERAAQSPPLTLHDLVPTRSTRVSVVHHGKNSLPLFRRFEKHMCRADDGVRLFGFNEGFTRPFIGPGYFVATETGTAADASPSWRDRGGVVVDYFRVPDEAVAPGWPAVVENDVGLQRFVFRGMRDYLRRVSTHASIGAAFQGETAFNSWFVLCRD